MLVLSRKSNETICIDHDIIVTVMEIKGNRVKIGIQAPGDCRILRAEVLADPSKTQQPAATRGQKSAERPREPVLG